MMTQAAITVEVPGLAVAGVGFALLVAAYLVFIFNRLVRDRNLVREGWSGIDVQLKRRHNLIPNLVEVVAGYSAHERKVLEEVTRVRAESEGAAGVKELQTSENALSQALRGLFALAERYPELKADRTYLALQDELVKVEDHLQMARRYYNGTVRNYNIRVESFPNNLLAGIFGFRVADFFELETATEREAPKVEIER